MWDPKSLPDLSGRVFIVTGGNAGIGYITCLNLAAKSATVYMGARSSSKAENAIANIKSQHPGADIKPLIMDHNSLKTVNAAAQKFLDQETHLNGLILNGGIMNLPYSLTEDGFEIQMQVNYLAHWLLTTRLLPVLHSTARSSGAGSVRIVSVTSGGHATFGGKGIIYSQKEVEAYGPYGRYGQSKLANILHAKTLNAQYGPGSPKSAEGEIWAAAVHPGFVDTQLNEHNRDAAHWSMKWLHWVMVLLGIITPLDRGCISNLFVGASPDFDASMCGQYFWDDAQVRQPSEAATSIAEREKLEKWTVKELTNKGFL